MRTLAIWKRLGDAIGRFSFLLLCVVLFGGISRGTFATAQSPSSPPATSTGWNQVGPSSGVITVLGSIRQVVSNPAAGTPTGVHILIDGPLGSFDASLGSYLPNEVQQALSNGVSVQATGVVRAVNGTDYLFVRQLTVAGHQVTIRNSYGFLLHHSSTPASAASGSSKRHSEGDGGVQ